MRRAEAELTNRISTLQKYFEKAKKAPLYLQPTYKDSLIVLLHGHWENYLRELMAEYIDELKALSLNYSALPSIIQSTNKHKTVELLSKGLRYFDYLSHEIIAENYNKCLNMNDSSGLIVESFCMTHSSADKNVVRILFEQIGIQKPWELINSELNETRIRSRISSSGLTPEQYEELVKQALDRDRNTLLANLDRFVKSRNEIAHHGKSVVLSVDFPLLEVFFQLVTSLKNACNRIVANHFTIFTASVTLP